MGGSLSIDALTLNVRIQALCAGDWMASLASRNNEVANGVFNSVVCLCPDFVDGVADAIGSMKIPGVSKVADDSIPIAMFGWAIGPSGFNGVGKMIIPCSPSGPVIFDVGLAMTGGTLHG